jgi:N-glycosylase/DNA lyase
MTHRISPGRLTEAVAVVGREVAARVAARAARTTTERHLWWELSCCVLSSQVPYALAVAAADAIDRSGYLWTGLGPADLDGALEGILRGELFVSGRARRYRFARSRASHLAATHDAIMRSADRLSFLLGQFEDPVSARKWLVRHAPGLGPKQASMFLRNCGVTYDLAVLDRHVIWYMSEVGLLRSSRRGTGSLSCYSLLEQDLRSHASEIGHAVGLLDWAIWIVARAAKAL